MEIQSEHLKVSVISLVSAIEGCSLSGVPLYYKHFGSTIIIPYPCERGPTMEYQPTPHFGLNFLLRCNVYSNMCPCSGVSKGGGGGGLRVLEHLPQLWHNSSSVATAYADNRQLVARTNNELKIRSLNNSFSSLLGQNCLLCQPAIFKNALVRGVVNVWGAWPNILRAPFVCDWLSTSLLKSWTRHCHV